jgi:hypothetical protein
MKHRHKLQQQRQRTVSPNNAAELQEDEEVLPGKAKPKKQGGSIHAARAKHHLGKRSRVGQKPKRYDDGGSAGGTRSPNDPGDEIAAASRGRKGTLGRIQDELLGPKSAYKRGGRLDRARHYDAGGAASPPSAYEGSLLQQFNTTPQLNPVVKFVKQNQPPPSLQTQPPAPPAPSGPFRPRMQSASHKEGGRVRKSGQGIAR